jgi:exopolysaccharide biosynthesis protein
MGAKAPSSSAETVNAIGLEDSSSSSMVLNGKLVKFPLQYR